MPFSVKAVLSLLAIGAVQVAASKQSTTTSKTKAPSSTTCKTSTSTKPTTSKPATTTSSNCGTDNCLQVVNWFPALKGDVSTFCSNFIHASAPATSTSTSIVSKTVTVTGTGQTDTIAPTETITETSSASTATASVTVTVSTVAQETSVCSTTVTITQSSLTTSLVSYKALASASPNDKRDLADEPVKRDSNYIKNLCNRGCDSRKTPFTARLSSACSCYLGKPTTASTVVTSTVTVTASVTGRSTAITVPISTTTTAPGGTVTSTAIETSTATSTTTVCGASTSTITKTALNVAAITCGATFTGTPTAATSGTVTCSNNIATPSANILFRIEGLQSGDGTIAEGCYQSGPRDITTPSGGTHPCNGNSGAPGTTPTNLIDTAARAEGFSYDGTYSNTFSDFFITRIASTAQNGNQFWGVLQNNVFTSAGGCGVKLNPGDSSQWIFDAFSPNKQLLGVTPGYQVVELGSVQTVAVTVTGQSPNGGGTSPFAGASIGGVLSDSSGQAQIPVPTEPGCYQYKALNGNNAPSNAFYLTVLPAGSFTG